MLIGEGTLRKGELEVRGTRSSDVKCRAEEGFGDEIRIGKLCCDGWSERSSIAFRLTVKMWRI